MFKLVVGNPRLLIKEMFPIIIPVWHIIININIIIIIIVVWHLYFNLAMWVVIRTQRMFSISINLYKWDTIIIIIFYWFRFSCSSLETLAFTWNVLYWHYITSRRWSHDKYTPWIYLSYTVGVITHITVFTVLPLPFVFLIQSARDFHSLRVARVFRPPRVTLEDNCFWRCPSG